MKKLGAILLIVLLLFFGYRTFLAPKADESSGTTNEVLKNDVEVEKEELDESGNVIDEEIIGNEIEEEDENIFKDEDNNESSNSNENTNNNESTGNTSNNTGNTGGTGENTSNNTGGTSNNTSNTGGNTSNNTGNTNNNNTGNTNNNTTTTTEYGTVVINYVDEEDVKIAESTIDSKAKVGSTYKYNAPTIDGYINDTSAQTVTISTKGEKKEITFKYANEDYVPYISTYSIEHTVKTGQEVKLKFYVTDYYQKEHRENDNTRTFKVIIKATGKEAITKTVKAGNTEISLGSFATEGNVDFSIIVSDKYGRNSHEIFHYFRVHNDVAKKEYVMTEADLQKYNIKSTDSYEKIQYVDVEEISNNITSTMTEAYNNASVPSNSYLVIIPRNINDNNTKGHKLYKYTKVKYASNYDSAKVLEEAKNTRIGLQNFLDDVKAQGYNSVKLIKGVYRIDHEDSIYVPTEFTLDLNGATIKLNQFTGDSACMIKLAGTYDSHLINGIIEGDYYTHDYTNSPNNSEWVNGVALGGKAEYSSIENLEVKDITGYGVTTGLDIKDGYTDFYPIGVKNWEYGEINKATGEVEKAENRAVSGFVDLKKAVDVNAKYVSISKYLGYQGRVSATWNLYVSFYDKDKKYISSIDAYQYKKMIRPENAAFLRVTAYDAKTATLEDYAQLNAVFFRVPTNSIIKNILIDNVRCVGMAPGQMNNLIIEDIEFTRNGQSGANCAFDAEDGWDGMQDVTFRRLNFHDNAGNDFLTCGGHNFIVEDMIKGTVYIYGRTNGFVYEDNTKNTANNMRIYAADRARNGYYRIRNNILGSVDVASDGDAYKTKNWPQIIKDSIITGRVTGAYTVSDTDYKFTYIAAKVYDSEFKSISGTGQWNKALGLAYFERCTFNGTKGENFGGIFKDCTINNATGNLHSTAEIYNSRLNNFKVSTGGYEPHLYIENSVLNDFKVTTGYWGVGHYAEYKNNTITLSDSMYKMPHYSFKYPITIKNNNITITNNSSLFEFYDDRDSGTYEKKTFSIIDNTIKSNGGTKYLIKGIVGKTNANNIMTFEVKNNQLNGIAILEDGVTTGSKVILK